MLNTAFYTINSMMGTKFKIIAFYPCFPDLSSVATVGSIFCGGTVYLVNLIKMIWWKIVAFPGTSPRCVAMPCVMRDERNEEIFFRQGRCYIWAEVLADFAGRKPQFTDNTTKRQKMCPPLMEHKGHVYEFCIPHHTQIINWIWSKNVTINATIYVTILLFGLQGPFCGFQRIEKTALTIDSCKMSCSSGNFFLSKWDFAL